MYTLYGALASPYSMKMRAVPRYRRIPFVWKDGAAVAEALKKVRAPVIPVLEFPEGSLANDSTPLIHYLEARHGNRSIVPPDLAIAFLACLLEDFADEWLTKPMFGYRWLEEVDQVQMSRWLAHIDDLSGHEGEWSTEPSECAFKLARIAGEVYALLLAADAVAFESGADQFTFEAMGQSYSHVIFKYQVRWLANLRARFALLGENDRQRAPGMIGTDWSALLGEG